MNKKGTVIAIIIKSVAIVLIVIGVLLNFFQNGDFMAGSKSLLYFTIQSNILAAIISAVGIFFDVQKLRGKQRPSNDIFNYFKLVATTGVTLTLIVFWTLLTSMVPPSYLYSVSNLTLHTLVPILVLLDYIFFTDNFKPKKRMIAITWSFPLFYFAFAMILSLFEVQFSSGTHVPYFFLDYEKYGWFKISSDAIGVFYWVVIILILVYAIGFGVHSLNQVRTKYKKTDS